MPKDLFLIPPSLPLAITLSRMGFRERRKLERRRKNKEKK